MAADDSFSWPFPKTPQDLLHLLMIMVVLLIIGLVVAGFRYESYKNLVLDKGTLQLSAQSLDNTATAAVQLIKQQQSGQVTGTYFQVYADQLASQAESTAGYVAARQAKPEVEAQAGQLAESGRQLKAALQPLSQPSSAQDVQQASAAISKLEPTIKQTEASL